MRLVGTLLVSTMLLGGTAGFARAADTDLPAQIEAAATPEQHQALADLYTGKAAEARQRADLHRRMADRYAKGKSVLDQGGHCRSISARLDEDAKDYDALAAAHAAQAKK